MSATRTAADTGAPTPWAELVETQRLKRGMGNNEFSRFLDHPKISTDVVSRWRKGAYGVAPALAIHVAVKCGLPASIALRAAGHAEVAAYIEDVAGDGSDAASLEPVIARVREITDGLTDTQRSALREEMLKQISDLYLLTEAKARQLRDASGQAGQREAS